MKRLISPDGKPTFVADALVSTYLKKGYTEENSLPPTTAPEGKDTSKDG